MVTHEFDVAIIGGGLAGGCLARQLRLAAPDLRVGLFERRPDGGFKVGESTVEIAANYLARRLRLNRYLFDHHLLKNGLRYFFDTEAKDGSLFELSEIGTDGYPFHPSFQLDRARFDRDLRAMNRDLGVDVREGVTVRHIELRDDGAPHRFTLEGDGGSAQPCRARWLVDASGRARVLARTLGEPAVPIDLPIAAVWGRMEGVADIDAIGPEAWRARVRHTSRYLSTNHLCYPGYWIWFIPLRNGIVSVGVVGRQDVVTPRLREPGALLAFLREHRAAAQLLEDAHFVDVMGFKKLAYGTRAFYSEHRFGRTGEAGAFLDPFYSPGSDFIATENDHLADLIVRDLVRHEAREDLAARTRLYDQFVQYRLDSMLPIYDGLYDAFGSFALMCAKYSFDVDTYYNVWVHAYLADLHLDTAWIAEQLRARAPTLTALANVRAMFQRTVRRLRAEGRYFADNLGGYLPGQAPMLSFLHRVGRDRSRKEILRQFQAALNRARRDTLALQAPDPARVPQVPDLPLMAFMTPRDLLATDEGGTSVPARA